MKSAREAQGKSLDDIGSELKIRADHAALEAGDFDKFDAPILSAVSSDPIAGSLTRHQCSGRAAQSGTGRHRDFERRPGTPGKRGFVDG